MLRLSFIFNLLIFNLLIANAAEYESTVYGKKIRKSTQIEVKAEDDPNLFTFGKLSDYLGQQSPMIFEASLMSPPQWTFRGSGAAHSLLLVDESPIYDPSTIQGTWDLNLWPSSWTNTILIETSPFEGAIKWGGHGSGSLIKITSFNKSNISLGSSLGAPQITAKSWLVSAGHHFENAQLQLLNEEIKNRSPFVDSNQIYPLKNSQAFLKLDIPIVNSSSILTARLLYGQATQNIPDWNQDAKNYKTQEKHQIFTLGWHSDRTARLNQTFGLQISKFSRLYSKNNNDSKNINSSNNESDSDSVIDIDEETYLGNSHFLSYHTDFLASSNNRIKFGFTYLAENLGLIENKQSYQLNQSNQAKHFNQDKKNLSIPSYISHEYFLAENLAIHWGVRAESNGNSSQFVLNPAAELHGLNWSIAYFRTLKRPSLFQLYDFYSGNPLLIPEHIEQITLETHDLIQLEKTYQFVVFKRKSTNIVDYDSIDNKYHNFATSNTNGFEFHFSLPIKKIQWNLMGTLQNSFDQFNKRIAPQKQFNSSWNLPISNQSQTQISGSWNSELKDRGLPTYNIWNWSMQYIAKPEHVFSIAIHNLTQTKVIKNKQHLIDDRTFQLHYHMEF